LTIITLQMMEIYLLCFYMASSSYIEKHILVTVAFIFRFFFK